MTKFSLTTLLLLLASHSVISGENKNADESVKEADDKILPIIYIEYDNKYLYPTDISINRVTKRMHFVSKTHTKESFFCPAETKNQENDITTALSLSKDYTELLELHEYIKNQHPEYDEYLKYLELSEHCLFKKEFNRGDPLTCPEEPVPAIRKLTETGKDGEEKDVLCGPGDAGILYEFYYLACPSSNIRKKLEITPSIKYFKNQSLRDFIHKLPFFTVKHTGYRFCYNHTKNDVIYTKHRLRSEQIMDRDELKYEGKKFFPMITDDYKFFNSDHFEKMKKIYEKIEEAQEKSNSDINEELSLQYKGKKLVSPDDFATALWKKPTHHILNVKPMYKPFVGLWEYIDETIRAHFRKGNIELDIYTGTFDLPNRETPSSMGFIHDEIKISETWVKIVYDFAKNWNVNYGTAITMLNYKPDNPDPNCTADMCHPYIDISTVEKQFPGAGHAICCEKLDKKHMDLFNLNLKVDYALAIGNLSYESNTDPNSK